MSLARRLLAGLLVLVALTSAQAARAGDGDNTVTTRTSAPVSWTLSPGSVGGCPQLVSEIKGQGTLTNKITVTTFGDGSRKIVDRAESRGNATDTDGRTYKYTYRNDATIYVPATGTQVIVEDSDTFTLRGGNSANRVDVSFHWLWTYQPASVADVAGFASVGFPGLDPNAINVIRVATYSDPLLCDPI